ncbi:hypothetical protein P7D15_02695 [Bacillus cereus]|uniref:Uncharacterized protein n=1 Tax=Bacillus thuringiensis TaxID=1428 RepID=A0A9X6Z5C0_BACTU|nr:MULTISPECIES: hypothetical protein [Bacillus cereus group]MCU5279673.1 hypothetical protein [Bacillus cereus]MDF9599330.1 hypothetical protein [Bacillus cereus]MDG1589661.1 hypothetical protein [Bacillus cereus]MEC3270725.1 hypothetical protein [Bacillus thuringiensis]PFB08051.1 hypothetical protein CN398_10040 [Bacillus thuringiensis]
MMINAINSLLRKKGTMICNNGVMEFCSAEKQAYLENEEVIASAIKNFIENFNIDFLNEVNVYEGRFFAIQVHQQVLGAVTYKKQKLERNSIRVDGMINVKGIQQSFTLFYNVSRLSDDYTRIKTVGLQNRKVEGRNLKQLLKEQKLVIKALNKETRKASNI